MNLYMLLVFFCEINIFRYLSCFFVWLFRIAFFQKFTPGIVEFRGLFGVIGRDDDVSLAPHSHGHLQNSQIAGALQHGVLGSAAQGEPGQPRFVPRKTTCFPRWKKKKHQGRFESNYKFSWIKCPYFSMYANSIGKADSNKRCPSVRCGRDDDLGLPMKAMFQDICRGKVTWVEVTYVCHINYYYANIYIYNIVYEYVL